MNPIQSILVHVDAGAHGAPRLKMARALGARLGAGVTALYAVTPVYVELALEVALAGTSKALLEFDDARRQAARNLVSGVCAEPGVQVEWREAPPPPEYSFIREAFCADLLVLGQHDPQQRDSGVLSDFVPTVILGSGKPALVVPYIGARSSAFETVLVAWKDTRESARALAAALPLLQLADTVHVALDADTQEPSRDLLQQFLRRHDVAAQFHTLAGIASMAGEAILSLAADVAAELLVMGCYGHGRARELVMGGASRTVLASMTLPVLMAH
jgi:nucleotide-binding universal stress UspA family protein